MRPAVHPEQSTCTSTAAAISVFVSAHTHHTDMCVSFLCLQVMPCRHMPPRWWLGMCMRRGVCGSRPTPPTHHSHTAAAAAAAQQCVAQRFFICSFRGVGSSSSSMCQQHTSSKKSQRYLVVVRGSMWSVSTYTCRVAAGAGCQLSKRETQHACMHDGRRPP
jgi:hypothetical protein